MHASTKLALDEGKRGLAVFLAVAVVRSSIVAVAAVRVRSIAVALDDGRVRRAREATGPGGELSRPLSVFERK